MRSAILNGSSSRGFLLAQRRLHSRPAWLRRRLGWALLYAFGVGSSLAVLAFLGLWAGFWLVALLGVWYGIWIAFSAFWRWADETRKLLLRQRGYY